MISVVRRRALRFLDILTAALIFLLILALVFGFCGCGKSCTGGNLRRYGVFLGIGSNDIHLLDDFEIVVIEPSEFSAAEITSLRQTVYGYINIGAIEEYRPYYERFQNIALGVYENWQDERWVDVSDEAWQDFVVEELGRKYAGMGLDGFFLDNADVYYNYPSDEVFDGLCAMLRGLKEYDIPLIINGGDVFVSKCIDEGTASSLFDGVNQETVFTSIDFENADYGVKSESESRYFQDYLSKVKDLGMDVYLLEYAAPPELAEKIDAYCTRHGFVWYNANGWELNE